MPEGYFPDGEPGVEEQATPKMIQEVLDQYENHDQLDLVGHLSLITKIIQLVPYSARMWHLRGTVLVDLAEQRHQKTLLLDAKESYQKALALEPDNFAVMLDLGYLLLHAEKNHAEASVLLDRCVKHYTQQLQDAIDGAKTAHAGLFKQKKVKKVKKETPLMFDHGESLN